MVGSAKCSCNRHATPSDLVLPCFLHNSHPIRLPSLMSLEFCLEILLVWVFSSSFEREKKIISVLVRETKDFYEAQIEILKKEMQCMSKELIEERKSFQREMQRFYQNSQLQLKEQISEQNRRMEQLIREQFNTLISVTI